MSHKRAKRLRQRAKRLSAVPPARIITREAPVRVAGGSIDDDGYRWPIVIIEVGPSLNAADSGLQLYYTREALETAAPIFEGVQSFSDHATEQERRTQPMGAVEDVVGVIEDVHFDPNVGERGALVGTWVVVDETMRQKTLNAAAAGVLDKAFAFSISAAGESEEREIDGVVYEAVTRLHPAFDGPTSVDAVTVAAAGGRHLSRLAASLQPLRESGPMTWQEFTEAKPGTASVLLAAADDEALTALLAELGLDEDAELIEQLKAARTDLQESAPDPETDEPSTEDAPAEAEVEVMNENEAALAAVAEAKRLRDEAAATAAELKKLAETQRAELKAQRLADSGLPSIDQDDIRPLVEAAATVAEADQVIAKRKAYLAKREETAGGDYFPKSNVEAGADEHDTYVAALDGWFAGRPQKTDSGATVPRFSTLHEAIANHRDFKFSGGANRLNPTDYHKVISDGAYVGGQLNTDLPQYRHLRGTEGPYVVREGVVKPLRESVSTSTFAEVFADRANKSFIGGAHSEMNWQELISLASLDETVSDFKTHRYIRVGEYANPGSVSELATYPTATTPGDVEETASLTKYGYLDDISLEALTDPDGQRLRQMPMRMGQAMGRLVRQTVLNAITTDNPTMNEDATAMYDAGHSNTGTTALTVAELDVIETAMTGQTAAGSSAAYGSVNAPWALLVPRALMSLARRITTPSTQYVASPTNAGTDTALDPLRWQGQLRVVELTHASDANNYFVMANPAQMDTFVIQRLAGVPEPEFFQQFDPSTGSNLTADKSTWKVRFFLGVAPLDYRSFYREVVA